MEEVPSLQGPVRKTTSTTRGASVRTGPCLDSRAGRATTRRQRSLLPMACARSGRFATSLKVTIEHKGNHVDDIRILPGTAGLPQ